MFGILVVVELSAQLPSTEIYHFTIENTSQGLELTKPQYLTGFNQNGYNNQPLFFSDHEVYFTTDYYDSTQTEIAKFDLTNQVLTRITATLESEYSPTPMPGQNEFTCVRVELDNNIQSLTSYPLDGLGVPTRYLSNVINVGYHSWINNKELALFLVEAPNHNLAICEIDSEKRKVILDKIGRCLKTSETGNLLFVHKVQEDMWFIKSYNLNTSQSSIICQTPAGSEDFELLADGSILMGQGSKIMKFNPSISSEWETVADLKEYNISAVSRISVKNNRLILVNQKT